MLKHRIHFIFYSVFRDESVIIAWIPNLYLTKQLSVDNKSVDSFILSFNNEFLNIS